MKITKWFLLLTLCLFLSLAVFSDVLAQDLGSIQIIFLHHSCGHNLIEGGNVREGLSNLGYAFFDHGYNGDGLRLADGSHTGESFNVPDDNTDPDGFATIFSQPLHDPPDNTFSHLMQYDVIAFKSCFPTSNIADDAQLAAYQTYYLTIRDRVDQYPQKLFVIVTPPPQVPNNTTSDEARRARLFADWLTSDEYLAGHPNLVTFDFFYYLAGEDNTLREEYRVDQWDAHPNDLANSEIGPEFVAFLDSAIRGYFGEVGVPAEPIEPAAEESQPEPETEEGASPQSNMMNMEEMDWHADTDGEVSSVTCSQDTATVMTGGNSLYVNYALGANGYASCANLFDSPLDWTGEEGVSFYLRSDRAGQEILFLIFSGSQDSPVPFEARFSSSDGSVESWERIYIRWEDFNKSPWHGEGGIDEVDPSQIISFVFSIESEEGVQGQFWVDGLSPLGEAEPAQPTQSSQQEEPLSEENGNGGICPFSTLVLPILVGSLWIVGHKQKQ